MANNQQGGNTPYGSGDPYYTESTGFLSSQKSPGKGNSNNWIKIGIPVAIVVIAGAIVGAVIGVRHSKDNASSSASAAQNAKAAIGIFPTGTDSLHMMPLYPSTTNSGAFSTPTFVAASGSGENTWPTDPFSPSDPAPTNVRSDRPRLIAPAYKWDALPDLIANDPYMKSWNDSIFNNATQWYNADPVEYFMDGDSGILDNCRDVKRRVKAWGYCYRMTNDTKWVDRTYKELVQVAGNNTGGWGPSDQTKWNPTHFLDTAEMTAAFALAYDWMYEAWTDDQKSSIFWTMMNYGLDNGKTAYGEDPQFYGWWKNATQGNWNCVCNNGLTMAALAIMGDDTTGTAEFILQNSIPSAVLNCAQGVSSDGTWSETNDYWYFAATGHAEMTSSLISATGSDYNILDANENFQKTGWFHMYASGPGSLFQWGDNGPNKYTATANSLLWYADQYNIPQYALFQRDQYDAPDPFSMFWYNPAVSGAFWDGTPLDRYFDNSTDQWVSMRSSWTDQNQLWTAMKAGTNQGHQTHNDLDVGDFIIDALGERWAGELGDADYRAPYYFSNDTQGSGRWMYYRKMTAGQNTILVNKANQDVTAAPKVLKYESTNEAQGSSTVYTAPDDSTAYWTADITSAYFDVTSLKRGVRMINGRKQILIQDEINTDKDFMWRMHTNATVDTNGQTATLKINDKTMEVKLLSPSDATWSTMEAKRFDTDPTPPEADQENPGVTVLTVQLSGGTYTIEVLFNPQWDGMSGDDFKTPSSVALDDWSLTSHN